MGMPVVYNYPTDYTVMHIIGILADPTDVRGQIRTQFVIDGDTWHGQESTRSNCDDVLDYSDTDAWVNTFCFQGDQSPPNFVNKDGSMETQCYFGPGDGVTAEALTWNQNFIQALDSAAARFLWMAENPDQAKITSSGSNHPDGATYLEHEVDLRFDGTSLDDYLWDAVKAVRCRPTV